VIPNVDERLASVIRALTDVVLPSLPKEAGLAIEQVQLTLGHLQIIRAQLDATPGFEAEELANAIAIAEQLGAHSAGALDAAVAGARAADSPAERRAARIALHGAIGDLIRAHAGHPGIAKIVIAAEEKRVVKDRAWFAPFGFDAAA
jgi:ATP phosphoribosyltransferase regulatory subunit HisZ